MVQEKYWEGTNQVDRWWANYVLEEHGWNGGWCSSKNVASITPSGGR